MAPVSDFNKIQSFTLANLSNYLDGYKTAAEFLSEHSILSSAFRPAIS